MKRGFSLIELTLSLTLFGIVIGGMVGLIIYTQRTLHEVFERNRLSSILTNISLNISKDLMGSPGVSVTPESLSLFLLSDTIVYARKDSLFTRNGVNLLPEKIFLDSLNFKRIERTIFLYLKIKKGRIWMDGTYTFFTGG